MHFTGTVWRPPYEADSLLLEVTAGCTHHKCKFCTLYDDIPFPFKMSPMQDITSDLLEIQTLYYHPMTSQANKLTGQPQREGFKRAFLTGANPFVLQSERLLKIAARIYEYVPTVKTIGCFARITDIKQKTEEELLALRDAGYTGLTIGMETGDTDALQFMNKGYTAQDILEQCKRLDAANTSYAFFYLTGISGAGKGALGATRTADICNQLHPKLIGANMLTIYPNSELYQEIQRGNWKEEREVEKYQELQVLIKRLNIPVQFAAMGASNAVPMYGNLPQDKEKLLMTLNHIITQIGEEQLRDYRTHLRHL